MNALFKILRAAGFAGALLLSGLTSRAAPNVLAHYANGQVWLVWNVESSVLTNCIPTLTTVISNGVPVTFSNCLAQTYAIYWSPNPVTNTTTATLVGRLFAQEWSAGILRDDVNASFGVEPTGFRIPDGAGGYRVLGTNQGVFVHTVRTNFSGNYGVRPWGETNVPTQWRAALTNAFFSLADPPTYHFQASGTNDGYPVEWWTMWADGDTNLVAARPDFPIMENDKRRGVPHNFSITMPKVVSLPPTNIPACIAVHSGDGQAKMWLPDNTGFTSIGLVPVGELLIAIEDRLHSYANGKVDPQSMLGTGYVPTFDPFFNHIVVPAITPAPESLPASNAVIFPFGLYRFNWTLDWLYAHKNVDSNRVAVAAHSGGAQGSAFWTHASPERFAAVNLFNPALGGFPDISARYVGTRQQNLPLLLTNRVGELVRATTIHDFASSHSPLRDLPFSRIFHGKREENWVTDNDQNARGDIEYTYRQCDALGLGAAVFWDLRSHGVSTWTYETLSNDVANPKNCLPNTLTTNISATWSITDLWLPTLTTQYRRDDATNQIRHRADKSYPAFFNCSLRGGHGDPGVVIYTNNTVFYDDFQPYDGLVTTTECRPPWGGYFDWETNISDTATSWSAVVFLVGAPSAFNPVESCPDSSRVCDVAIRRPQQFKPATGTLLEWRLENAANGILITNGNVGVGADDLVSVGSLRIPRDPIRARLVISLPPAAPLCPPAPTLYGLLLTNGTLELRWEACTNLDYQLETSSRLTNWHNAGPPMAAPAGGGWITNVVTVTTGYAFYRVRGDLLTNSPVPAAAGQYTNLFFTHDGILRSYQLSIPTNYSAGVSNAFAFILHGHGQSAASFAALHPGLFVSAETNNLILALPNASDAGRGTVWNSSDPLPGEYQVDDVSFLLGLLEQIEGALTIDRKRVYAGGFSSGGVMCHYLGARTTNVFAALAPVEASIGAERGNGVIVTNPPAAGPMPVMLLNATNSCTRPYWGGINDDGLLLTAAIDAAYYWTNANYCAASMTAITNNILTSDIGRFNFCGPKPHAKMLQPNQVILQRWGSCAAGTEVIFVTLTDGGHQWPNAEDNVGFDANAEVPRFFLRHVLP